MAQLWTYDSLAAVDRDTLESVLLNGTAPDMEQLNGYIYDGWNHEWIGKLSGEKFKKGFWKKDGKVLGFNEMCKQDSKKYQGEWKSRTFRGKPIQLAYFRSSLVKDEPVIPLHKPYMHLGYFSYDIPMNTSYNLPFRVIRDFVVLPNPGDHSLLLCKAYLRLAPSINILYCYFLLGHRKPIEFKPW
jgi:hypothetical protein